MIKREMKEAMDSGKTLIAGKYIAYFRIMEYGNPYRLVYPDGTNRGMNDAWDWTEWEIKSEPTPRPMTRMERLGVLTREGCVVRANGCDWLTPSPVYVDGDLGTEQGEYAIIDRAGNIIEGPQKFEVTE